MQKTDNVKAAEIVKTIEMYLSKIEDNIAELYEKQYKTEVAVNSIINIMIKKKIFNLEEFRESMKEIRKKVLER